MDLKSGVFESCARKAIADVEPSIASTRVQRTTPFGVGSPDATPCANRKWPLGASWAAAKATGVCAVTANVPARPAKALSSERRLRSRIKRIFVKSAEAIANGVSTGVWRSGRSPRLRAQSAVDRHKHR